MSVELGAEIIFFKSVERKGNMRLISWKNGSDDKYITALKTVIQYSLLRKEQKEVEVLPISGQAYTYWANVMNPQTRYLRGLSIQIMKTNTCTNRLEQPE